MRILNIEEQEEDLDKFFISMLQLKEKIVVWQLRHQEGRLVKSSRLHGYMSVAEPVRFRCINNNKEDFSRGEIYLFAPEQKAIFKTTLQNFEENDLLCDVPREVKILEDSDEEALEDMIDIFNKEMNYVQGKGEGNIEDPVEVVSATDLPVGPDAPIEVTGPNTKYTARDSHLVSDNNQYAFTDKIETKWKTKRMSSKDIEIFETELSFVSLDEEDKLFQDKRAAPRARPPKGKMVTIQKSTDQEYVRTFELFDLSRGGMGFIIPLGEEIDKGDIVNVQAFDDKVFDSPMQIEVKSIREVDSDGTHFKVGCQFVGDTE